MNQNFDNPTREGVDTKLHKILGGQCFSVTFEAGGQMTKVGGYRCCKGSKANEGLYSSQVKLRHY